MTNLTQKQQLDKIFKNMQEIARECNQSTPTRYVPPTSGSQKVYVELVDNNPTVMAVKKWGNSWEQAW